MTARAVATSLALGLVLLSAPAGASPPDEVPLAGDGAAEVDTQEGLPPEP